MTLRHLAGTAGASFLLALGLAAGYGVVRPAGPPGGPAGAVGGAGAPAQVARPPGLVRAGDSKTTCVYVRNQNFDLRAALAPVEQATGIDYRCLETFENAEVTWGAWQEPWVTKPQYGYTGWVAADPRHRTVVLTINLVPDQVAETAGWRGRCAQGAYRAHATALARRLVATGLRFSVIRLGPEMNGNWYRDSVGPTVAGQRNWARCFAQIVMAMRAVHGAGFLFDWNVNAGYLPTPLVRYYPGDAYVDIIGVDAYDASATRQLPPPSPRRWHLIATEPLGLLSVARFAATHHKALSIPEWGTLAKVGDDGLYVRELARVVLHRDVAYQSYFDSATAGVLPLSASAPHTLASYVASFGPGSAIAAYQRRGGTG